MSPRPPVSKLTARAGVPGLSRRQVLAASALAAGGVLLPRGAAAGGFVRERSTRALMGTQVDIVVESREPARLQAAMDEAFDAMAGLVAVMSHYRPTSRVGAINLAAGLQPVAVPPEMMAVLKAAQAVSQRSAGAFDVTIGSLGRWHFDPAQPQRPDDATIARQLGAVNYRGLQLDEARGTAFLTRRDMRLDLGGIAKLPILEAGLRVLQRHGIEQALVNGGGDALVLGRDDRPAWRIGVRDPHQPERVLGVLALRRGVVASSGDYERFFVESGRHYHHVLDPRTGYPTQGPRGVTLVADRVEAVNGLGAAVMVMGAQAGRGLLARCAGVDALIVDRDGQRWLSAGMRQRLQPLA